MKYIVIIVSANVFNTTAACLWNRRMVVKAALLFLLSFAILSVNPLINAKKAVCDSDLYAVPLS